MPMSRAEAARKAARTVNASRTPEQRSAMAAKAANARESMDRYVQKVVDRAPELTPEQRERLAAVLRPTGGATG